jgi:hypothetical protein
MAHGRLRLLLTCGCLPDRENYAILVRFRRRSSYLFVRGGMNMRVLLCFIILGALNGCIVLGGGSPPQHTTVVVPPGSTVTCVDQSGTDCHTQ